MLPHMHNVATVDECRGACFQFKKVPSGTCFVPALTTTFSMPLSLKTKVHNLKQGIDVFYAAI